MSQKSVLLLSIGRHILCTGQYTSELFSVQVSILVREQLMERARDFFIILDDVSLVNLKKIEFFSNLTLRCVCDPMDYITIIFLEPFKLISNNIIVFRLT